MRKRRWYASARGLGIACWLGLLLSPVPARAADPVLMFFLGFARNLISSAVEESQSKNPSQPPARVLPPISPQKPAASFTDADLRALVDESFVYLSSAQREELLAGLEKTLADPANAGQREAILTQFVTVARQIQFTHAQLSRLSSEQKLAVAERFARNFQSLPSDQQQSVLEQLKRGALPVPADLNDMMLAALGPAR